MDQGGRRGRRWLAAALALGVLAGCSGSASSDPGPPVDELSARDGEVCPERLPTPEDAEETNEPAGSSPELPSSDRAWICAYDVRDREDPEGQGLLTDWVRAGEARPVPAERLAALESDLAGLQPIEDDQVCSSEAGPRWMLVLSRSGDLTGVVVDDFGCEDVRLTDEPFETVPGEATQPGTVSGVLAGSPELADDLESLAS